MPYLVFNEGYCATSGEAGPRRDLCQEAIRLTRVLVALAPDEPESAGLLALLLLQHARRDARFDTAGHLVLLPDQDRSRWDRGAAAGLSIVDDLSDTLGGYHLWHATRADLLRRLNDRAEVEVG